jgi:hypothetical protein
MEVSRRQGRSPSSISPAFSMAAGSHLTSSAGPRSSQFIAPVEPIIVRRGTQSSTIHRSDADYGRGPPSCPQVAALQQKVSQKENGALHMYRGRTGEGIARHRDDSSVERGLGCFSSGPLTRECRHASSRRDARVPGASGSRRRRHGSDSRRHRPQCATRSGIHSVRCATRGGR